MLLHGSRQPLCRPGNQLPLLFPALPQLLGPLLGSPCGFACAQGPRACTPNRLNSGKQPHRAACTLGITYPRPGSIVPFPRTLEQVLVHLAAVLLGDQHPGVSFPGGRSPFRVGSSPFVQKQRAAETEWPSVQAHTGGRNPSETAPTQLTDSTPSGCFMRLKC
eukprot:1156676-Pelagomonas_calceolata.AAC.5